jgi:predicted nucleic acid-binding protein
MSRRPFVDTNVLLCLISADAAKATLVEPLLAGRIIVSVQVLNEFTNFARRKHALPWPVLTEVLTDILFFAEVRPLTLDIHLRGRDLAQRYGFSVYDALIVAAALEADCDTLLSEDLQHGQRVDKVLTIRNPFA